MKKAKTKQYNNRIGNSICQTCRAGEHGNAQRDGCNRNQCVCKYGGNVVGVKATGAACTTHNANICTGCNKGYKKVGDNCVPCPAGKVQTASLSTASTCNPCSVGKFQNQPGKSSCDSCHEGAALLHERPGCEPSSTCGDLCIAQLEWDRLYSF